MSYSAYPRNNSGCRRAYAPYTIVSTLLFIFFVWYIYDPPADPARSAAVNQESEELEPIPTHIKAITKPDAHLCNDDDAFRHSVSPHSHARCLDGSLPAFYLRKGTGEGKHKWLVYFEGGGWCFDAAACKERARTVLGSSADYPRCLSKESMKHYTSSLRSANPMMSSWNTVRVRYCDGGSYAGNSMTEVNGSKLYFRGQSNRDETIRSLLGLGMRAASEVVLLGCSAGALGVYLGIDEMARLIRAESPLAIVRGLAVSGFFQEHTAGTVVDKEEARRWGSLKDDGLGADGQSLDYPFAMRGIYELMNLSAGADADCVQEKGAECIFAKHLLPHISTPLFTVQSQYDYWHVLHIIGRNYTSEAVNAYGHELSSDLLTASFQSNGSAHGVFVESCAHHCVSCSDASEDTWNGHHVVAAGDPSSSTKYSPGLAFKTWYARSIELPLPAAAPLRRRQLLYANQSDTLAAMYSAYADSHRLFVQNGSYPCHSCCSCALSVR